MNTLKNENEKLARILRREVGDNFNLEKMICENSQWRGRAQQIQLLKAKIKSLQGGCQKDLTASDSTIKKVDQNPRKNNKILDQERLLQEKCGLEVELEELGGELKGLKARNKVLLDERSELKKKLRLFQESFQKKSQNDDLYISTLKQMNEKLKFENEKIKKSSLTDENLQINLNLLGSKEKEIGKLL